MIHVWQMRWTGRAHAHSVGTINARADTLSWLCDERWWPCACLDDNSLKGTRINVFTFTVQHNNRCCKCVQTRTNAYIEKPAYTCLHIRELTVCSWGQIEAKCIRNDTVLTRTRAAPGAATSSTIQGRAFWLKTNERNPPKYLTFSLLVLPIQVHGCSPLARQQTLVSSLKSPSRKSRIQNVLSSFQWASDHGAPRALSLSFSLSPSQLISFFHSLGFSFPVPSFGWCQEMAVRRFEGRDELCVRVSASWWHER